MNALPTGLIGFVPIKSYAVMKSASGNQISFLMATWARNLDDPAVVYN
jgi:hypothetical protein